MDGIEPPEVEDVDPLGVSDSADNGGVGRGEGWPDDVEALIDLKASGLTNEAAATLLGCSARTVQRRLGLDGVHHEIGARRQLLMSDVAGQLVVGSDRAVAVLMELLDGDHDPTRLRAAQSILQRTVDIQRHTEAESELGDRVALLEELTGHVAAAMDYAAAASLAAGGAL